MLHFVKMGIYNQFICQRNSLLVFKCIRVHIYHQVEDQNYHWNAKTGRQVISLITLSFSHLPAEVP